MRGTGMTDLITLHSQVASQRRLRSTTVSKDAHRRSCKHLWILSQSLMGIKMICVPLFLTPWHLTYKHTHRNINHFPTLTRVVAGCPLCWGFRRRSLCLRRVRLGLRLQVRLQHDDRGDGSILLRLRWRRGRRARPVCWRG